jgi:hypothetical protein
MKGITSIIILIVLVSFPFPANAVLIDRGTGMIYDTDQGITWLQDANYAQTSGYDSDGRMNWDGAVQWADSLSFGAISDWRLPSAYNQDGSGPSGYVNGDLSDPNDGYTAMSEMGYLWHVVLGNVSYYDNYQVGGLTNVGPFNNLTHDSIGAYWSGTEYAPAPESAWYYNTDVGSQNVNSKGLGLFSWAVRDGDYGPSVSTEQTYTTDAILLGDTFSFDYFWELGIEPTEFNLDIIFFRGTEWETLGWTLNFDGNSEEWASASFWVPEWARGLEAQIRFSLFDLGQTTDPTVYLRNIGSSTASVPEPSTLILMGAGLAGIAGMGRKKFIKSCS